MAAAQMSGADLEQGSGSPCISAAGSDGSSGDEGSCYSQFYSTSGSYDEGSSRFGSGSSVSVEIDSGGGEIKLHLGKLEKDCRICHLGLESNSSESGDPIDLGCSCKGDLAAAHTNCAEAWFKIRGNKTCEICHSIAKNVVIANEIEPITGQSGESNNVMIVSAISAPDGRSFWHGHRFLNFLLACMVVAFVISWLFHFKMPSH